MLRGESPVAAAAVTGCLGDGLPCVENLIVTGCPGDGLPCIENLQMHLSLRGWLIHGAGHRERCPEDRGFGMYICPYFLSKHMTNNVSLSLGFTVRIMGKMRMAVESAVHPTEFRNVPGSV